METIKTDLLKKMNNAMTVLNRKGETALQEKQMQES